MTKEKMVVMIFGFATLSIVICGFMEMMLRLTAHFQSPDGTVKIDLDYANLAGILIICSAYYLCKFILLNDKAKE